MLRRAIAHLLNPAAGAGEGTQKSLEPSRTDSASLWERGGNTKVAGVIAHTPAQPRCRSKDVQIQKSLESSRTHQLGRCRAGAGQKKSLRVIVHPFSKDCGGAQSHGRAGAAVKTIPAVARGGGRKIKRREFRALTTRAAARDGGDGHLSSSGILSFYRNRQNSRVPHALSIYGKEGGPT